MSIIDDILASNKAGSSLFQALRGFTDNMDMVGFSIFIRTDPSYSPTVDNNRKIEGMDGKPIEGVLVNSTGMGTILTARASLNGLKKLLDDPRVVSVEGSRPLRLNQAPSP